MCTNRDGVATPANAFQLIHAAILLAGTIRAEQYAELRNTYVYNGDDSLDSGHPFEIPFKIVSELTLIQTIKLSFRIMPYRAYSTAASSGGADTSGSGGGQTSSSGGGQTSSGASGYPGSVESENTNLGSHVHDIGGSHVHTMPSHEHDLGGTTQSDPGGGNHTHDLGFSSSVSSEDPGNTDSTDLYNTDSTNLGNHSHTVGLVDHTHTVSDHTHTVANHTHTTPNHTHGVTYGIHEESNSPTVHFHIDNGAGFGGPSANYGADQLDVNIAGSIAGVGWKAIRFDTDLRCRIAAIIECKLDITA
jgi:hypothetical protein